MYKLIKNLNEIHTFLKWGVQMGQGDPTKLNPPDLKGAKLCTRFYYGQRMRRKPRKYEF